MLDELKPSAAIVATTNVLHLPVLRACAARKIAFFSQKSIATTFEDAKEMERLGRATGIRVMINCFPLWSPLMQQLFREVEAGTTGPIYKYVSHHGHQGHKGIGMLTDDYISWLYDPVQHGGGSLIDHASYGLNFALHLMGRPQSGYAINHNLKKHESIAVEDDSAVMLGYSAGTSIIQVSSLWPFGRSEVQV